MTILSHAHVKVFPCQYQLIRLNHVIKCGGNAKVLQWVAKVGQVPQQL